MTDTEFERYVGEVAETKYRLGNWEKGHQVVVVRRLDKMPDPLLEVETNGRLGSAHFSELEFLGKHFAMFDCLSQQNAPAVIAENRDAAGTTECKPVQTLVTNDDLRQIETNEFFQFFKDKNLDELETISNEGYKKYGKNEARRWKWGDAYRAARAVALERFYKNFDPNYLIEQTGGFTITDETGNAQNWTFIYKPDETAPHIQFHGQKDGFISETGYSSWFHSNSLSLRLSERIAREAVERGKSESNCARNCKGVRKRHSRFKCTAQYEITNFVFDSDVQNTVTRLVENSDAAGSIVENRETADGVVVKSLCPVCETASEIQTPVIKTPAQMRESGWVEEAPGVWLRESGACSRKCEQKRNAAIIAESGDADQGGGLAAATPDSAITPTDKKPKSTLDTFREKGFYPGGKANVFHTIINQMPWHGAYVELFAGNAAIARRKRRASYRNVLVDADAAVCEHLHADGELKAHFTEKDGATERVNLKIEHLSALEWLDENTKLIKDFRPLIYADPPYLKQTRRSQEPLYACEFWTDDEHRALLEKLIAVSDANTFAGWRAVNIIVSGYQSELYDDLLAGWRRVDFTAYDRAGNKRTESLWCNFPEPQSLHDYRFLGANFRARERIKRQQTNWKNNLLALPAVERSAMLDCLQRAVADLKRADKEIQTTDAGDAA